MFTRFTATAMAPEAHSNNFRSETVFFHGYGSLSGNLEMTEAGVVFLERAKERLLHVSEIRGPSHIYTRRSAVYKSDSCRRVHFHVFVWKIVIQFCRESLTTRSLVKMVAYNIEGQNSCHHPW